VTAYVGWLRQQIGPALVPLAYATAVVRDRAGRILFQRRVDFGNAWWGLPGGVLEPGETPLDGLRREVLEETGLRVEPLRLTGLYSSPRYQVTYPNGDRVQQVTLCYECGIAGGNLRPQADEIAELRFFGREQLPSQPAWYADMLVHALEGRDAAYFDPPEHRQLDTPYQSLRSVRLVLGNAPLVWPAAGAAVFDERGRLLLQRRRDNGRWGLPGGALDTGESLAHTVQREVLEETGLRVRPVRLVGVYAGYELAYPNGDRVFPVAALFTCEAAGGALCADGDETAELRYFKRDEMPHLPPHMQARIADAFAESDSRQSRHGHAF
jgi:8-oxo-dGTP pyrophosphatase MutT (NUDIX family)